MFRMNSFQRFVAWLPIAIAGVMLAQCGGGSTSRHATKLTALPFVQDDYSSALGQAKKQGVPLFVESWAPW